MVALGLGFMVVMETRGGFKFQQFLGRWGGSWVNAWLKDMANMMDGGANNEGRL